MIHQNFDPDEGIISPDMLFEKADGLPDTCIITFSKTVLDHALAHFPHQAACAYPALNGERTIWRITDRGEDILLYMSPITSAGAGLALEHTAAATGATHFILFGSCGALDQQLTEGRLIVPTAALGYSLGVFWTGQNIIPTFDALLIILAHVAFTYPLVVRNVAGAVEEVDPSYEETARTLGAKPVQAFRRVLFPMIKGSILAGAIMAFTRSLGETGATQAVVASAVTAPVYIVKLIKSEAFYTAGLACIVLIIVSYVAMLALRYVTNGRRSR